MKSRLFYGWVYIEFDHTTPLSINHIVFATPDQTQQRRMSDPSPNHRIGAKVKLTEVGRSTSSMVRPLDYTLRLQRFRLFSSVSGSGGARGRNCIRKRENSSNKGCSRGALGWGWTRSCYTRDQGFGEEGRRPRARQGYG